MHRGAASAAMSLKRMSVSRLSGHDLGLYGDRLLVAGTLWLAG